jgi:hypothetical protein
LSKTDIANRQAPESGLHNTGTLYGREVRSGQQEGAERPTQVVRTISIHVALGAEDRAGKQVGELSALDDGHAFHQHSLDPDAPANSRMPPAGRGRL